MVGKVLWLTHICLMSHSVQEDPVHTIENDPAAFMDNEKCKSEGRCLWSLEILSDSPQNPARFI